MKHYFCSVYSKDYAYKGAALYDSLVKHDKNFCFFIVCMDDDAEALFIKLNMSKATLINISDIEKEDAELLKVKSSRNDKEYCWTAKGSVLLYILNNYPETDHIVFIDGDSYFYSDPQPVFDEWGKQFSIMMTKEWWRDAHKHNEQYFGIYNGGFMGFRKDAKSFECLRWYRSKLIEWCYDRHENGLWSDQLYLNDWPERFKSVIVLNNIGVNLNPYIIQGCKISQVDGDIYVNDQRLIFYHSYGFRYYDGNEFDLCSYNVRISDDVIKLIYLPYIYTCREVVKRINGIMNNFYSGDRPGRKLISNYFNLAINEEKSKDCRHLCTVTSKDYVIQCLALLNSLNSHSDNFNLWICCVDDTVYELLNKMNLKNATILSLENIKSRRIQRIGKRRKIHEFCWTLKSVFVNYIVKYNYAISSILYIDADVFFYESIDEIYKEWKDKSVYLTKLWLGRYWIKRVGYFSAGLIGFKRDNEGLKCLRWWRRKCLNWCYDIYEEDRWSDQKYLNYFPDICSSIEISGNWGMNAGPWSLRKHTDIRPENNSLYYNGCCLICYHFSGVRVFNDLKLELCYRRKLPRSSKYIYDVYIKEIVEVISEIIKTDNEYIKKLPSSESHEFFNEVNLNNSH